MNQSFYLIALSLCMITSILRPYKSLCRARSSRRSTDGAEPALSRLASCKAPPDFDFGVNYPQMEVSLSLSAASLSLPCPAATELWDLWTEVRRIEAEEMGIGTGVHAQHGSVCISAFFTPITQLFCHVFTFRFF